MQYQDYYPYGMVQPERNGTQAQSQLYRQGFNGMERDDEMAGSGNSLDFGARMYNLRLGRFMSVDPKAAKYPGINPYHFGLDNPILFMDSDGQEGRLTIVKDPKGGGTIVMESTVFLYGPNASADLADRSQQKFDNMNRSYNYIDAEGNSWTVQLNVQYKYEPLFDQYSKTKYFEGDRFNRPGTVSTMDPLEDVPEEVLDITGFERGDNVLYVDQSLDDWKNGNATSHAGGRTAGGATYGTVREPGERAIVHESFHNLGYSDWYRLKNRDIMSFSVGNHIDDIHFIDLAQEAISEIKERGNPESLSLIVKDYIESNSSVKRDAGDLGRRSAELKTQNDRLQTIRKTTYGPKTKGGEGKTIEHD